MSQQINSVLTPFRLFFLKEEVGFCFNSEVLTKNQMSVVLKPKLCPKLKKVFTFFMEFESEINDR